jgi:hypothetical protein
MHGHGKNLTHLQSILLFKDSSNSPKYQKIIGAFSTGAYAVDRRIANSL